MRQKSVCKITFNFPPNKMLSIRQLYTRFEECSRRVTTDSRDVVPGALFFALRGDRFDGNRFVVNVLEQGAGGAVCDDPVAFAAAPPALKARITLVGNALEALQRLATHHRRAMGFPVLAITGTNGKTTTKELIHRVLSQRLRTAATVGNLNNQIGVPLTLLAMDADTQLAVVEMGAGALGEIALLCRIARPDYGIITNIGLAHLEGFGDVQGVRRGKGELYDYLAAHGGTAFYRTEDEVLAQMIAERPDLHAIPYASSLGEVPSHLEGDYNTFNIAAAVAVGDYFEVPREATLHAIESYIPDNQRSEIIDTTTNRVIVDCYNANPSSMRAALEHFARMGGARKAVILGDMLELGGQTAAMHADILLLLKELSVDEALLVGPAFREATQASGLKATCFADAEELASYLKVHPLSGRLILVKGSRGIKLERLLPAL